MSASAESRIKDAANALGFDPVGNRRDPDDIPALAAALDDHEPLVREHAAWALQQFGTDAANAALAHQAATGARE